MKHRERTAIPAQKYIGTANLRRHLGAVLEQLSHSEQKVITEKGKPRAVLVDFDAYIAGQRQATTPSTVELTIEVGDVRGNGRANGR